MRDTDWDIIVTLHKTGSITKTAELLFISQPALTKRIQSIEGELGFPLLIRTRTGSVFTPEGEKIAKKADQLVGMLREIKGDASSLSSGGAQTLRVGFPYSFVRYLLPDILEKFTEKMPNVEVEIHTMASQELVKAVEDGIIDVCFARFNAEESFLQRMLFSRDQAYLVNRTPLAEEDIPKHPYISYNMNPGSASTVNRWWTEHYGGMPEARYKVTTGDACLALVRRGLGTGIFMDGRYFPPNTGLWKLPLKNADGSPVQRNTWVFYRAESRRIPAVDCFIRMAFLTEQESEENDAEIL